MPGWLAVVGLILIWVAWRGVTGKMQALHLGAAGLVISAAHYITKQPTLIIDTNAEDCHVVYGSDTDDYAIVYIDSKNPKWHDFGEG